MFLFVSTVVLARCIGSGMRKLVRVVNVGGRICVNMLRRVLHTGERACWNIVRGLPHLFVIWCASTVLCIVIVMKAMTISLYLIMGCIVAAIFTELNR
jgi:hypothetical protein